MYIHAYTKWINIGVRDSSGGGHYLLQRKICVDCGKEKFINRKLDGFHLFHGRQSVPENFHQIGEDN